MRMSTVSGPTRMVTASGWAPEMNIGHERQDPVDLGGQRRQAVAARRAASGEKKLAAVAPNCSGGMWATASSITESVRRAMQPLR